MRGHILINSQNVAINYSAIPISSLAQINTNGLVAFCVFRVKGHIQLKDGTATLILRYFNTRFL